MDGTGDVCVVMPTYNERENLAITLHDVFSTNPEVHVLVVDDGSPDGTGDLAGRMAAGDARIHVLHRLRKAGLGPAYVAGFRYALGHGYRFVCEMDMDGSHRGADLAGMLKTIGADPAVAMVIGSRRVDGGSTPNWPWYRDLISRAGSWYARTLLALPVHDLTAGFRVYRAAWLRKLDLGSQRANGYVFQIDMTRRVAASGGVIVEVPVTFPERVRGRSKMSMGIVAEAMMRVTVWGLRRLLTGRSS